jgi:hypothetical protein
MAVCDRVGFAVWQLQELEAVCAKFLMLRTQLKDGVTEASYDALVEKALRNTFGVTLRQASDANIFPDALQARFNALLAERNWLIHKSRLENRAAYHDDSAAQQLIQRVNDISAEVRAIMQEIDRLIDQDAMESGISLEELAERTNDTLAGWHAA